MTCSGRPNSGHLILRSTSGLLDGGAAAVDDAPRNDEALLCRLEMPIVGGADPKEKGLGEAAGACGSSGMWATFSLLRCLHSLCRGWKERTFYAPVRHRTICPRLSP